MYSGAAAAAGPSAMGAKGGSSPQPWAQYKVSTTFLRVPPVDWAAVKHGSKSEFRSVGTRAVSQFKNLEPPTPVVAYVVKSLGQYDSQLMVLTAMWTEPLGAISAESLEAEGFPDIAHFRRYWMARTHRRFRPLTMVQVYRVRQYTDNDAVVMGVRLHNKLYRDHL